MISNKITTILIDDEEAAIQVLSNILVKSFSNEVEVINTSFNFDEGLTLVDRIRPDVVFLDIDIEDNRSGFDFLKEMRKLGCNSKVIFVTAHEQFGIRALREEAFDYIVKPVDADDLRNVIQRLAIKNSKKECNFILINNKEALHKILLDDLLYISAEGGYTEFHVENRPRPILTSYNLSVIEKEISSISNDFYRIHNSFFVNKSKIVTIKKKLTSKKIVLTNDIELPISRSKYIEFLTIFMNS